jgi:hypothetical protein
MILLRDPDCPPNCAQHPHVLQYIPVFPRCLIQIVNTFLERALAREGMNMLIAQHDEIRQRIRKFMGIAAA